MREYNLSTVKGVSNVTYKIMHSGSQGYALFVFNHEAQMWQQVTKWYRYLGNLKRFANI